jgi:hypothetical protein
MKNRIDIFIEHFEFHLMRIKRTQYKSESKITEHHNDLYILDGEIVKDWWRKEGHLLLPEDVPDIINSNIEALVVGTGSNGKMKISQELKNLLMRKNIPIIEAPTEWAVKVYNHLRGDVFSIKPTANIAAAFHLTC